MANPLPSWRVVGQVETTGQSEDGHYTKGVDVAFETGSGLRGTVFVPNAQYRPDQVKALVAARAAAMEDTHKLTG